MSSQEYLNKLLSGLPLFPDSNNCVILYLKSKPEELHNIKYIYFTYIGSNYLLSLCHGANNEFILVIIKNNECKVYLNIDVRLVLQNLTKSERKNILGLSKKNILKNSLESFHALQYLNDDITIIITKLNSLKSIFDISGLLFISDEIIDSLNPNENIYVLILNNNTKIRNISKLVSLFPNIREIYLNNMKHLHDENINDMPPCDVVSISNCSITLRVLLHLTKVKHIILNCINLECQTNMYSTVILKDEWDNTWNNNIICTKIAIISNNLTFDCIKCIVENTPNLIEFRLLDVIITKMRETVKSGYEKEIIEFVSDKNKLRLNRDLKWKSLLINNCTMFA